MTWARISSLLLAAILSSGTGRPPAPRPELPQGPLPKSPPAGSPAPAPSGEAPIPWPLSDADARAIAAPGPEAPALVLLATGSTGGEVELCGCHTNQGGGVARRGTLEAALSRAVPGIRTAWLDAGAFAADWSPPGRERTLGLVEAMNVLGYRAANLTPAELSGGWEGYEAIRGAARFPLLGAGYDWEDGEGGDRPFPAWILVEEGGIRIGVVGVARREEGFRVTGPGGRRIAMREPAEVVPAAVREARTACDYVILLGALPAAEAEQVALRAPGIDLILGSWGGLATERPRRVGSTSILYAGGQGRYVAEIDLYRREGKLQPWVDVALHYLRGAWPEEPGLAAMQRSITDRANEVNRRLARAAGDSGRPGSGWAGAFRCRACHAREFAEWEKSRHAHAIETLRERRQEWNPACLPCHVVGHGREGGFRDVERDLDLADVQCESCHGPGAAHAADPSARRMGETGAPGRCLGCHTPQNSPAFDFPRYWQRIRHGERPG